jgi:hypothetical protein
MPWNADEQAKVERSQADASISGIVSSQVVVPDGHTVNVQGFEVMEDIQRIVFTYTFIKKPNWRS